jgi:hypothetical protein
VESSGEPLRAPRIAGLPLVAGSGTLRVDLVKAHESAHEHENSAEPIPAPELMCVGRRR